MEKILNKTKSANHKERLIHLNILKLKFMLIKGHYNDSETINHTLGDSFFYIFNMITDKGLYLEYIKNQLEKDKPNRKGSKEYEKAIHKRKTIHGQ